MPHGSSAQVLSDQPRSAQHGTTNGTTARSRAGQASRSRTYAFSTSNTPSRTSASSAVSKPLRTLGPHPTDRPMTFSIRCTPILTSRRPTRVNSRKSSRSNMTPPPPVRHTSTASALSSTTTAAMRAAFPSLSRYTVSTPTCCSESASARADRCGVVPVPASTTTARRLPEVGRSGGTANPNLATRPGNGVPGRREARTSGPPPA
jgi:hypothetical protein